MNEYTKQELEEAKTALASTLHKCEKMQESGRLQSSQKTLNDRRVKALRIALTLIEKEMRSK
ncbi:MAG: hypothetical protein VB120_01400 [Lachnospiraceae bacterium]|jgi:hypothetical protein|uniref:hypothetical protein n=1 Tax=Clostridia TaxID=186801 RepID=UPI000828393C|nr:hypothetical protein [Acetivibrio thermocellus]MEA4815506.1 hypothetical protein [Lachnospiraceae bacterium]OCN00986.1 hypothetical protein A7X67_00165 [Clostridium sp. W14A]ODM26508.1 hypothetical protein A7W90_09900 [Clostridium sp. Bc-iso-3]HRV29465.1 hypothetical protein [Spirochaetia bacterium]THJ77596.1 hypothetical protein EPD62_10365 [Acetivibrio thermocellus]